MGIRVLLVDDHQILRDGLRALLSGESGVEVVGEAPDGRAALERVGSLAPDVVVMDIVMPELNGIEATRRIVAGCARVRVVALSMCSDDTHVRRMLDAGATGYVPKSAAHDELVRAIRAAGVGRAYLSPLVTAAVVERATHPVVGRDVASDARLGRREREVLQLVAEGRTSAETARTLHISVKTVETHRRNISRKLELHGTAELTKYAVREGLTSIESTAGRLQER
jgi:two-component system NarL family response regulator